MTQEARITAFIQAVGTDIKAILANEGSLTGLTTTAKGSLVAAINEIKAALAGISSIDDALTSGTTKTYSIDKIKSSIQQLKTDLLGGVPATAFDTLKEIADYIGTDATATSGLVTAIGKRLSVEGVQSFTLAEKLQARQNIDAYGSIELGNPDTNLVTIYTAAKA